LITLRKIDFYNYYFVDYYISLDKKAQHRIEYVFKVIQSVYRVPQKFLKHIEGSEGLYEIRINTGDEIHRIFCCFDKGNTLVCLNGFKKKSRKTPKREIEKAQRLRNAYFMSKRKKR